MHKTLLYLLPALLICCLTACSGGNTPTDQQPVATDSLPDMDAGEISEENMDLILSLPSPKDLAGELKTAGARYEEKLLNPDNNVMNYKSQSKQAMNMGVYTADLSYASVFDNKQMALKYLKSITKLTEELSIANIFGRELENRIQSNEDNIDSLNIIFDETFQSLNEELKRTKQENTLELMFAGGWVESFYLTCAHWGIKSSPEIRKRIMEQSTSLETLLKTLEPHKTAEGFSTIYPALVEINGIFAAAKGAELSDDQVKQLHAKIKTLRNAITQ